ncbi:MAG: HD domain-containing protein [Phaeodactylibacter sp.]|nr:HD domain-containing protein [Phaeodactylibacter sp.]
MEPSSTVLQEVEQYVQQRLLEQLPATFVFHNYEHAAEVAEVAEGLAKAASLTAADKEVLLLAAWLQDIDMVNGKADHESRSADTAKQFLQEHQLSDEIAERVAGLILSTQSDYTPDTLLEKLLHDANWSFVGRKRFFKKARLLRLENEHLDKEKFSQAEWNQHILDLLIFTKFLTPWAQEMYGSRKTTNISTQRQNLVEAREDTVREKTGKNFGRGIDTLYRVALRNHSNLSTIADGKANMIISVNTLVLSLIITVGTATFSLDSLDLSGQLYFIIPLFILMVSSLLAIIFAVLSAMPKVGGESFTMKDVKQNKLSLLFFGNFIKIDREIFVNYLRELKKDQELVYDDLTRDLYNLGEVLNRKYYMLMIAYRIFMGGLIVSVTAFLIAYLIAH